MLQIPRINTKNCYPKISFKGGPQRIITGANMAPLETKILRGVNNFYAKSILTQVNAFPSYWLNKFKEEGFQIVISKSMQDAFTFERVNNPNMKYFEALDLTKGISTTYIDKNKGIKFFAFNGASGACLLSTKNNVNHELCKGIINVKGLTTNQTALYHLYNDLNTAKNSKTLTREESLIGQLYFWNEQMLTPKEEIMADTLAWQMGAGKYGGGLIMGLHEQNLTNNLFPNLSKYLAKVVEHIKD